MQDSHRVLVADDEDVQSEVFFEFLDPAHRDVVEDILLEVQSFKIFGVILNENTLSIGLHVKKCTYLSCLTMAQIMELQISR